MSSSIFSFEVCRDYRVLPAREKRWHIVLVVTFLAVFWLSRHALIAAFGFNSGTRANFRTSAVAALGPDIEVLFVGSSHVSFGIWPALFSTPTMALSSGGLSYECQEAVVRKHLERLPQLKVVVIELDPVPYHRDTVAVLDGQGDMRPLFDLGLSAFEIPARSFAQRWRLLYHHLAYPFFNLERLTPDDVVNRGLRPAEYGEEGSDTGFLITQRSMPPGYANRDRFEGLLAGAQGDVRPNERALHRMIGLLSRRGIRVVLMRLPHHPTYWEHEPPLLRLQYEQALDSVRDAFAEEHQPVVWDLGRAPGFSDAEFLDVDHLNTNGARKVAPLLDARLQTLDGLHGAATGS